MFGIDLGTTNSIIGHDNVLISGLVPSIVDIRDKNNILAGTSQLNNFDAMRCFKVNMSEGISGYRPIVASTAVLKELARIAQIKTREDVVISVPAYFNHSQRNATIKAANNANMNVRALINEPTAAAVFINENIDGTSVVFDLGGGTFDISVIESKAGKHRVISTDGRILGGMHFDAELLKALSNIADIGQWRTADDEKAKDAVCKAKLKMQHPFNNGAPIPVTFEDYGRTVQLTKDTYEICMRNTFKDAILLSKSVIEESGYDKSELKFYFVGGSTRCPYLRAWVGSELGIVAEPFTYDPDKVVAQGACYFANMLEKGLAEEVLIDVSKQIGFALDNGIMEVLIPKNTNLPYTNYTTHIASYTQTVQQLELEFYQGDSILINECSKIGTLLFNFSAPKDPGLSVFDLEININHSGVLTIKCGELLKEPQEIVLEIS